MENFKGALGKQANKFDHLLFPPPLHEMQYLYFPVSEKIAEHDLSQENYRPAYSKPDALRWQSAFSLRPQLPALWLTFASAVINASVILTAVRSSLARCIWRP